MSRKKQKLKLRIAMLRKKRCLKRKPASRMCCKLSVADGLRIEMQVSELARKARLAYEQTIEFRLSPEGRYRALSEELKRLQSRRILCNFAFRGRRASRIEQVKAQMAQIGRELSWKHARDAMFRASDDYTFASANCDEGDPRLIEARSTYFTRKHEFDSLKK